MNAVRRQSLRNDLLRLGVDHQMQFAPRSTLALTVRPHLPFAFAVDFQAGTVNDDIDTLILPFFFFKSKEKLSFAARLHSEV